MWAWLPKLPTLSLTGKRWLPRVIGLLLVALAGAVFYGLLPTSPALARLVDRADSYFYDTRLVLTMSNTKNTDVVVVDIDEKSLKQLGQWPWPRSVVAQMVDSLFEHYGVQVVGFDIVFSEPDRSSPNVVFQRLVQHPQTDEGDKKLIAALQNQGEKWDNDRHFEHALGQGRSVVMGYVFDVDSERKNARSETGSLPAPIGPASVLAPGLVPLVASGYTGNMSLFQQAAASGGFFNPNPDDDGVIRRVPMLIPYQGQLYESLSLAMIRLVLGQPAIELDFGYSKPSAETFEGLVLGGAIKVPLDDRLQAAIPYIGGAKSFNYVSAAEVIDKKAPKELLEGKMILVGTSAPGLLDLRSAPMDKVYPGVEVHANLLAGMVEQNIKQQSPLLRAAERLSYIVVVGLLALLAPSLGALTLFAFTIVALATLLGTSFYVWNTANLIFPVAKMTIGIVGVFVFNVLYGFFVESRARAQVAGLFGQYVPPAIVEELSNNPEKANMEGDSKEMSILFSDVRGFTTLSEKLDPRELSRMMNAFLTPFSHIIYDHNGTIDKYIGDCIMAFWGAPLDDAQHASHGIAAGLAMQKAIATINQDFATHGWSSIAIGIGLNSGKVSVGNMGSSLRLAYTVMGDAVNLASRLEGLTKQYHVVMIVGEETRKLAPEYAYRELDRVQVKGKKEPVTIYEPLKLVSELTESDKKELALLDEAHQLYRDQQWQQALAKFELLYQLSQVEFYTLYLERIEYFQAHHPQAPWNGVFEFHTK